MHIDLNADLGEGCGDDAAILRYVSSANIACGWHAGDARTMRDTARAALAHGVALGAHPSFPDRAHFGRRAMQRAPAHVYQDMLDQIGALDEIVREEGGQLQHVKPHGALYNQAAGDEALAEAIARAVHDYHPGLKLVGLAGGALVRQARKDAPAPTDARVAEATGQAARQGRAYRELFQLVRDALTRAEAGTPQVQAIDAEDAGYTDDSRAG